MGLLELPEVVIESNMLKYLSWNDLLRLRRVCHRTKEMIDGYIRVHSERAPEIEINPDTGKTFAAFMTMGIPTTKLYLSNLSGYRFYQDAEEEDLGDSRRQFMATYGPRIEHLRVTQITMWPNGNELEFLNSLVNISSFQASHFGWSREVNSREQEVDKVIQVMRDYRLFENAFPAVFQNLKSIRIGENRENEAINQLKVTAEIFMHCQKLKTASLPFTWTDNLPPVQDLRGSLMGETNFLKLYMETRPNDVYTEPGRLELYDFIQCHDDIGGWNMRTMAVVPLHWFASLDFMELLVVALETGLRFANVSPFWFYGRDAQDGRYNRKELGIPVVSLRGLHPMMMTMDMPNLEKIVIPNTSRCVGVAENESRPEWPALKCLDVTVDDWCGCAYHFAGVQRLQNFLTHERARNEDLWRLLFEHIVRVKLTELVFKFEEDGRWKEHVDLALPNIASIVGACPNLNKIHLTNWPGPQEGDDITQFWQGLPWLEEVTLENCEKVGNHTFVGEDKENPVFFKLQNLKKLSLKGLDKMPEITDLLFSTVLAKMSLKELVLTSDKPLDKITPQGITALLEGPFAGSIEKFPFQNWSMAGVCPEEFKQLEMMFRSSRML